jgi:hypothetical protein
MNKYACPKCNKYFKQKSHFIYHTVNKKKPCLLDTLNTLDTLDNMTEKSINTNSEISTNEQIDGNCYSCDFCEKKFTRKDSLNKHIKSSCKNKKTEIEMDNLKELLSNAFKEIEKIKLENELLKNCIPHVTNTSSVNNGTVNSVVNNNLINNGNTINIVQFGKEDISKMDFMEAMNVFLQSTGGNIISNMLKHINFNPNYPENYNICMTDLAREIVKIYNGEKFVCKKFKTVKDQIIGILSRHINKLCIDYTKNIKTKKSEDILKKININNISLRLINGEDFEDLIRAENIKDEPLKIKNEEENKLITDTKSNCILDELNDYQLQKMEHLESKREGLQIITGDKLKDELYNNRGLVNKLCL